MKKSMLTHFSFLLSLLWTPHLFAQAAEVPIPQLIEIVKPSVVAILALDDTILKIIDEDTIRFGSSGSGVLVNFQDKSYALTNEHVIAIKDSLENTIRYPRTLFVSINIKGRGKVNLPAVLSKADEKRDLAALRILCPKELQDSLEGFAIHTNMWQDPDYLKEGEVILYSGFPYGWGQEERNYPISRLGIVAQLIPGDSSFLIDAFVQPGYSGSPVFLIREKGTHLPPKWDVYFVGLAQSFPYEFADVYMDAKYAPSPLLKIIDNPGFACVIGTSSIRRFFEQNK